MSEWELGIIFALFRSKTEIEKKRKIEAMNVNSDIYRKKSINKLQKDIKGSVNSGKLRQRRMQRDKRRRFASVLFTVLICLAVFFMGAKTLYNHFQDTVKILQPNKTENTVDWESEIAKNFDKEIINFVIFGFDRTAAREKEGSSFRPDTIMIASVNFRTNNINLVSIPRDTYVMINDLNFYDKINHSYVHGFQRIDVTERHESGQKTLIRTVQDFLGGVPLHYYINLDIIALREIVDAVGGIHYDVEHQVRNYGGRGRVVIEPGYQLLNGYQYMHYVRFRYVGGDFARIDRQQDILIETFEQVRDTGKLSSIPKIIRALSQNIDTNISASQMASLALYGMEINRNDFNNYRFEGFDQYAPRNGLNIYYMVPDEENRLEVIKKVFGVDVPRREQINLSGRPLTPTPAPTRPVNQSPVREPEPEPAPIPEPAPVTPVEPKPEPDPYGEFDPEKIEDVPRIPDTEINPVPIPKPEPKPEPEPEAKPEPKPEPVTPEPKPPVD